VSSRRAASALLAVALVVAVPRSAHAAERVSRAELTALAARAADDPAALARLRQIVEVDGHPVDMGVALGGATGDSLRQRLALLAAPPRAEDAAPSTGAARGDAARILEQGRFKEPAQPRPLRGVFRWLGRTLAPVGRVLEPLGAPFAAVFWAVSETTVGALIAGGGVVVVALLVSTRLVGRRGRRLALTVGRGRERSRGLDPDDLEGRADAAETAGRFDEAFRLRFLAGLVRLDRAGALELRPSLTTGALRRRLPSSALRDLSLRFEDVVYGGQPAGPDDVEQARRDWPRVLQEVRQ
jgi:hypothetical protein